MSRVYHGHAVPAFYEKFSTALQFFGLHLSETARIVHAGNKGEEREFSFSNFLTAMLPTYLRTSSGEVIDLSGQTGPALDLMIYDRSKNFPFYSQKREIIPAEALLASAEVKSTLTLAELRSSFTAAHKLKCLRPLKMPLASVSSNNRRWRGYRYYHGVFAYKSNLSSKDWASKEMRRAVSVMTSAPGQQSSIDFIYVVGRGLINLNTCKWIPENEDTGQALVALYFGLYNFITRENRRRQAAPFFSYATDLNRFWQSI